VLTQRATSTAIKAHDADDDAAPELVQRVAWARTPLITAGMGGMQVEDIAMEGLRRAVVALDDLETITALKSSL
jgi:hypothetical protein